jgi:hypothetical protein
MSKKKKTTRRQAINMQDREQDYIKTQPVEVESKELELPRQKSKAELMLEKLFSVPGISAKQKKAMADRIQEGRDFTGLGLSEDKIKRLEQIAGEFN